MKKKIKDIIKQSTSLRDPHDFIVADLERRRVEDATIPKVDLKKEHIENTRFLLNRHDLLLELPKNAVVAEIGVNRGDFSTKIFELTQPKKLHLVDAWGDASRYHDGLKLEVEEKFSTQISEGRVEINLGFSQDVLATFPDNYFDWVYLDTDHRYKQTAIELDILKRKVKPSGIIAGHDYIQGNWVGNVRYGVIEAVHELCLTDFWRLKFITVNYKESPSFAIERIRG